LLDFNGPNGKNPFGSLTLSGSALYGMTAYGGARGDGTVFALTIPAPEPSTLSLLTVGAFGFLGYPYEASQVRKDRIVKNFPKLEIGMSKERVAELIGDPDFSRLDYTKGPKEKWLGSTWTYWLRKRDSGVNVYDPCLEISFWTNDRAQWIVPSNIEGLKEKGSPYIWGGP
jgi:uncharacterized repeat protein (TIGR03803 family)